MKRTLLSLLATLAISGALTAFAGAQQNLPQSTQDRQAITYLQYQLTQPGVNSIDRREIQQRISQLQYDINTRPPIEAPKAYPQPSGPATQSYTRLTGEVITIPSVNARANAVINLTDTMFAKEDMCTAKYDTIVYLNSQLHNPDNTYQELVYIPQLIDRTAHQMRNLGCPAAP